MAFRVLRWLGALVALLILLAGLWLAAFGWNSLREPIMRLTLERTGRELQINGNLDVDLDWPSLKVSAGNVKFANPPWADRKYMLVADSVGFSIDLSALLRGKLALDSVEMQGGEAFLEARSDGRKNWVLREQRPEKPPLDIGRLIIEQSRIAYDDERYKLSVVADVSNRGGDAQNGLALHIQGTYNGLPVTIQGSGAPALALRQQGTPYPFRIEGRSGSITASAEGTITGIRQMNGIDASVRIGGGNLAELYPLLKIALPETDKFQTSGRIVHQPGSWRYQNFTIRIGSSDGTGSLLIDTSGKRTFMRGELALGKLDFSDLGPLVGHRREPRVRKKNTGTAADAPRRRVLPDRPFRTERWNSVDADVRISAGTIIRNPRLPIDALSTRLRMQDRVLTLDPLEFGVAGGKLGGSVRLDGRQDPIQARVDLSARGIAFQRLFPTAKMKTTQLGKVIGKLQLTGWGNSVARMLGSANGRATFLVDGGEISRLSMELADLHVLESIALKIGGDEPIRIRCGLADLEAKNGIMRIEQLIFDTEITHIDGRGSIDFGEELLDLTLTSESKKPSLIALKSPIFVRGSFAQPEVDVDRKRIALRGLGAVALGAINPLLALAPLIETGPGEDSNCGRLLQELRQKMPPGTAPQKR